MNHPQTCNLDTSQHLIEISEVPDLPMPTMATGSKPAQSQSLFMTSRMRRIKYKIYAVRGNANRLDSITLFTQKIDNYFTFGTGS